VGSSGAHATKVWRTGQQGGSIMKRSLFLAVSVIALMTISDQLLAAGAETPAPSEQAAPAARQRAPARARPAPTPQRQAASQPSSSFTGTQAGGFGGGNAGGGGFADPAFCGFDGFDPRCGTSTQNIGKRTGVLGGAEIGQMIPMGFWALGWAVDAQGNTLRSESSDQFFRIVPINAPDSGTRITESFSTSQSQPFGTTWRLKAGVMAWPSTLIYVTGGGAGALVQGNFNYQAVASDGTTASGTNTYDKFRVGYTVGGGVTFSYPGSPIGITVEYLYTNLGTVDQTILVTSSNGHVGFATTSMKTDTNAVRLKFSVGL
jgi:hypothetical protein